MKDDIIEQLEEMGCDPLTLSAKLAMGNAINKPHPDFGKIESKWEIIQKGIETNQIRMSMLNDFWVLVKHALSTSTPTLELQSKHIVSLTEYIHAKKRSVENINKVEYFEAVKDIPDDILQKIAMGVEVDIAIDEEDDDSQSTA